ncbi:hypothetical protein JTE90_000483 [Oedothorax gibbosus]|uniref:Translin-associated protein X n=1 Tax=Oedothorax gibbosus TaxID=931172 RepID=A0AAV6TZC2_9ARAC|nr:hypothetical protein JTE90_000483 [Oedothorax gibbosus]
MSYNVRRNNNQKKQNYTDNNSQNPENNSPIAQLFRTYQTELDARYDKYERLIKKSRDVTIESKRIIFLLHRVSSNENNEIILQEAETRLRDLFNDVISEISAELTKREVFQFIRAFSPGLQEFIEAVSFYYYLKNGNVVNIEEIHHPDFLQKVHEENSPEIPFPTTPGVPFSLLLTPTDFVLGIADLTGELMRKCINSVASGNIEEPFDLCLVLQGIYEAFLSCRNSSKELRRKIVTLKSSLQKVENACYAIKIRGSEIPKHMLTDFFSNDDEGVDCDL